MVGLQPRLGRLRLTAAALWCVVGAGAQAQSAPRLTVSGLRCEYAGAPLGVDSPHPRLSWLLASERRGEQQSAYRVLVASSPQVLAADRGDLWDSGKVVSSRSIQVPYGGSPLSSRLRCYWKVRAWDRSGQPSAWSAPATWTMGLLSPMDWHGRWIAAPPTAEGRLPIFRAAFRVSKPVRRADLYVCGLGACEVHLNGRVADDALFEPGWTNYRKTCLYRVIDLTGRLNRGENVLGFMLGNGMYNVRGGRYTKFTGSFGPPKLIAQVHLDYADGSHQIVASGRGWSVAPGPITFSCVYGGEDYDARLEQPGWDRAGFSGTAWSAAAEVEGPGGRLVGLSRSAPPIKAMRALNPTSKRRLASGSWVYDLGQNCSQMPRIALSGPAGKRVTIRTGEKFEGERFVGACHDMASYNYTLRGAGVETWMPRFTYVGARYLVVEGAAPEGQAAAADVPVLHKLQGVFVCGSSEAAGEFACSNPVFTRTAELVQWAIRSNTMSLLTDCPHREKLGWLEQDHLVGPSLMYNYALPGLFTKIAGDMADSQLPDGLVPDIAPEYVVFGGGFRDSPEWGSAYILVPWQTYEWYGDLALLRQHYPGMKRYVEYLGTKAQGHIVSHGLADWIALQATPTPQVATAFYYLDLTVMERIARLLGKSADAAHFASLGSQVRAAYNARFYDADRRRYATNTQSANAIPVGVGLAPPIDEPAIVAAIVADIRARGNALTVGEIGYPYLLRILARNGYSDVLCAMNTTPDHPGYGMMIARGATSLPETWDANPDLSLNHFMLGHVVEWFYGTLAGIRQAPDAVAFNRIVIAPEPAGDLRWVRALYRTPYGTIRSAWRKENGALALNVSVPVNVQTLIRVPLGPRGLVTESGKADGHMAGVGLAGKTKGAATYFAGAGTYSFLSR